MARLRPFFYWFGSKWRLVPKYPAPKYDVVIEPFAGSASYSLLHHTKQVILIDANAELIELWNYLIHVPESEILALPDISIDTVFDELPVPAPAKTLIKLWSSYGSQGTKMVKPNPAFISKYPAVLAWSNKVRERIANQLQFIRHWKAICGDYSIAPDVTATWFIDPPYQHHQGRVYKKISGVPELDYVKLRDWCTSRRGQVIVCEGNKADWLPFKLLCRRISMRNAHNSHRYYNELIWTKG